LVERGGDEVGLVLLWERFHGTGLLAERPDDVGTVLLGLYGLQMRRAGSPDLSQGGLGPGGRVIEMLPDLQMGGGEDAEEHLGFVGEMGGGMGQMIVGRRLEGLGVGRMERWDGEGGERGGLVGQGDDVAPVPDRGGVDGVRRGEILLKHVALISDIQCDLHPYTYTTYIHT
jgi:hypothetical protein